MPINTILRHKRGAIMCASIFVALTCFFFFISRVTVNVYDEGLILTGAFRILNGDIPSRDFYVVYGPGQFYILAGLFKVFGTNVLVARIYDSAIASGIVFSAYFLLKHFHPRWYSLCGTIGIIAVLTKFQLALYPVTPVLLISLISASFLIVLLFRDSSALSYFSISTGIALILLFRYDISIMAYAAFGIPVIILKIIRFRVFKVSFQELFQQTILILITLGIVPIIVIILLSKAGIFIPALQQILEHNSTGYVGMRSLPFPGIETLKILPVEFISVYFPILALLFGVITLILFFIPMEKLREHGSLERLVFIVVFISLTCIFFVKGWVRTSGYHMLLSNIPAVLLCFMCAYQLGCFCLCTEKQKILPTGKIYIQFGVVIISFSFLGFMLNQNYRHNPLYRSLKNLEIHEELPSLSIFKIPPDRFATALYIKNNTGKEERIHSGTGRHDKIYVNDATLYFLAQRMPASKWHHYEPGIQNSRKIQREIINDLEKNKVSLIMRDSRWDEIREPNKSAISSNVFLLDQYLEKHFHKEISFGSIVIYLKKF
jgi:hypothetical protein